MFPPKHGISSLLSPLSIFTGAGKVDVSHLKLEFGPYVHIFNDNSPTNTMAQRTTGAIALNSVGNSKGDYRFLNLETDRRVSRHQWTVLPMPQSVIQQVHYLALKDNMPPLKDKCLIFERRPGVPLDPHTLETEALDYLAVTMPILTQRLPRMTSLSSMQSLFHSTSSMLSISIALPIICFPTMMLFLALPPTRKRNDPYSKTTTISATTMHPLPVMMPLSTTTISATTMHPLPAMMPLIPPLINRHP